jgi:nitrite reductase/ring-hydroxylating ferredoxin subunit
VPPKSSARDRATTHGLLNVASLALFSLGWFASRNRRANHYLPLALQSAGVTTLSMAGWLGGTLVTRNQIGVDHRYADAGKWQEETLEHTPELDASPESALHDAAHGLRVNQMKLVHAGGERIAIGRTGKGYAAFQDRCTHKGGPLSDGTLACGVVQCPWHGSQFDVRTGQVKAGPAETNIKTYDLHKRERNREEGE